MLNMRTRTAFTTSSSQHLSQAIVQSLYEGIILLNEDGIVIFANATAEMLLGYPPGDLMSRTCEEFLDQEACEMSLVSAGQAHRYTSTLRHSDGRVIPANINVTLLTIGGETCRHVSIVALPSLGPLQEALMLEQRMAGIGTLTSSIAHELTNPISIITTTCENMEHVIGEAKGGDSAAFEQLGRYVEMVRKNGWRCAELVETLRTYAHNKRTPQATDLNEVIQQSLVLFSDEFQRKWRVNVGTELDTNIKPITCDRNQITQVLVNLLLNARDAMQPVGGQVHLKTWEMPELNAVAFSVRDTGRGLKEGQLDTIFDPFYTTKSRGEGTGLGLYVAAEIVREHKGWIRAQNNTAEAGATFTVMLPCS